MLEDDAEVMSNTQLEELLAGQPAEIQDEIVRINTDARPLALQVALLIPLLAALAGLANSFRMMRLPDLRPSAAVEGRAWREGDQRATGSASSSARARRLAAWSAAETSGQRRSSALSFWTSTAATSAWVSAFVVGGDDVPGRPGGRGGA